VRASVTLDCGCRYQGDSHIRLCPTHQDEHTAALATHRAKMAVREPYNAIGVRYNTTGNEDLL